MAMAFAVLVVLTQDADEGLLESKGHKESRELL